jgi:hypothetical protein
MSTLPPSICNICILCLCRRSINLLSRSLIELGKDFGRDVTKGYKVVT